MFTIVMPRQLHFDDKTLLILACSGHRPGEIVQLSKNIAGAGTIFP
jgi:hypothetical protein